MTLEWNGVPIEIHSTGRYKFAPVAIWWGPRATYAQAPTQGEALSNLLQDLYERSL